MADIVGATPWMGSGKSWPVGSAPGQTALFLWSGGGPLAHAPRLREWSSVGYFRHFSGGDARWASWDVRVWSVTLTEKMLAEPPPSQYGQVIVVKDTSGIGIVRRGTGELRGKPFGGVLSVSYTGSNDASDRDPSVEWFTPAGVASQMSIYGTIQSRVVAGWTPTTAEDELAGDGRRGASMAIELLPPRSPAAPIIIAPSDGGEISVNGIIDYEWQHQPVVSGGFQDAYRLRFDGGDGWMYWSASTNSLTPYETVNPSSVQGSSVDASLFTAMVEHDWQVSTREGIDGRWSDWSPASTFTPVTPPSVIITSPEVIHDDLMPNITWESTTPRGVQTAFRVQIADSITAVILYDSHAQPGSQEEWEVPPINWVNGGSYIARVMIQQTGGAWSSFAVHAFTLSWTPPAKPSITAAPNKHGIEVSVDVSSSMLVNIERIGTDGIWEPILSGQPVDPGAPLVITDVFAPYLVPTAYRVEGIRQLAGQMLRSGFNVTDPVTSSNRSGYLALASQPATSWVPLRLVSASAEELAEAAIVSYGLGDEYGRVIYGPIQGEMGQMTVRVDTLEQYESLMDILKMQRQLMVRWYPERSADGLDEWEPGKVIVISRSSRLSKERPGDIPTQMRLITFSWIEQPRNTASEVF